MEIVRSKNGVPIRLAGERWTHIVENHDDLAGRLDDILDAVESPAWITRGQAGSLIAWRPLRRGRFLSVIYRELGKAEGFIVTAFITTKPRKEGTVWP